MTFVPSLLVAGVYVAFRRYYTKDKKFKPRLFMEAAAFAFFTYIVMWVYRKYLLENFDNHGPVCENGYERQTDPGNPQQTTCVAVGHATYPVVVGFGQIPEVPK